MTAPAGIGITGHQAVPGKKDWARGAREEAERRVEAPEPPGSGRQFWRAAPQKAVTALTQVWAARHTKLWMRACWREGIVPLLQMHDCLDCSVSSLELAERV